MSEDIETLEQLEAANELTVIRTLDAFGYVFEKGDRGDGAWALTGNGNVFTAEDVLDFLPAMVLFGGKVAS